MLRRMDSRELAEWLAFYNLEPFGGDTQYIGHAITAATVVNVHRDKNTKPAKAEDFLPKYRKPKQTAAEQIQFAAMLTTALGGQDLREDSDG